MKTYKIIIKEQSSQVKFEDWTVKERNLSSSEAYDRLSYYEDIHNIGNVKVIRENRDVKQVKDMR